MPFNFLTAISFPVAWFCLRVPNGACSVDARDFASDNIAVASGVTFYAYKCINPVYQKIPSRRDKKLNKTVI